MRKFLVMDVGPNNGVSPKWPWRCSVCSVKFLFPADERPPLDWDVEDEEDLINSDSKCPDCATTSVDPVPSTAGLHVVGDEDEEDDDNPF